MTCFHLWNIKQDILKNVGGQTTLNTIDLQFMKCMKHRSVPQKREIHTGLELHEGELQQVS